MIVFGYPPDKYSVTAEYFRSLGESSQVEPGGEIANAFRIGYVNASEAMRAVRKNGEVLGGEFMVGAKWAVSMIILSMDASYYYGFFSDFFLSFFLAGDVHRTPHKLKRFWDLH